MVVFQCERLPTPPLTSRDHPVESILSKINFKTTGKDFTVWDEWLCVYCGIASAAPFINSGEELHDEYSEEKTKSLVKLLRKIDERILKRDDEQPGIPMDEDPPVPTPANKGTKKVPRRGGGATTKVAPATPKASRQSSRLLNS
jgi:hypothetical protein